MAKTIRVGLIGCGFYAQNHLHSWRDLAPEGAVLAAVCDADRAKAEAAGATFGAAVYTDAQKMLAAQDLQLIDIVTRQDTHRQLAEMTLGKGIATIVQKPFAPTWEDCIAIVETAQKAGAWLAVHENFRFQTPMRKVRAVIDSGDIGRPNWARISFRTGYDVYATQPYFYDEVRFAIADVGIHVLDLARFFMGEADRISCETQKRNPKVKGEDTATMMIGHSEGGTSVVECTYESKKLPDPFPETLLEIEGEHGVIVVERGCKMNVTSRGALRQEDIGSPLRSWTSEPWHASQEGAFNACRHFLDCVKKGVPAETAGADNLKSYALVDAAYRAAEERRAVAPAVWQG